MAMTLPTPPRSRRSTPAVLIAALLAGVLTTSGCADVLGLDGLSFDRTTEPQQADPSLGGSGGEPKLVPPGKDEEDELDGQSPPPPTQEELWGFPAKWPGVIPVAAQLPQSLHPSSPEEETASAFHVYEPATGRLTSHRLLEDRREEIAASWSPGFDLVDPRPGTTGVRLFGYTAEDGRNELSPPWDPWGAPEDDLASLYGEARYGNPGWTHVLPLRHGGGWRLVVHNELTGRYRVGPAITDAPESYDHPSIGGAWEPGWSSLLPYDLGDGEHGLLKLSLGTGLAQLDVFSEVDGAPASIAEIDWRGEEWFSRSDEPWTHALTFVVGEARGLLVYSAGSGRVLRGRLDAELTFTVDAEAFWAEGWTSLTLVHARGKNYALVYDEERSVAQMSTLDPLSSAGIIVIR